MVQHYLLEVSASCCCVAACAYGLNIHKRWMFATSFAGLSALACVCEHGRSAHIDVAGKRLKDGTYLSRGTAECPASLASAFIQLISHMGDVSAPQDYALNEAIKLVPAKSMDALPVAFQDGGGLGSSPDWSHPPQGKDNLLLPLRQRWREMLFRMGFPQRLRLHIASGADTCPLSDQEIQQFRHAFDDFATSRGAMSVSWDVPCGQPYCLEALHCLSRLLSDKDVMLFPALAQGVPTGYDQDIPASHVFSPRPTDVQPDVELQICEGNWAGAEADPQLLLKLVQSELDAGYLLEIPLDKALQTWGSKVAVGKMNIVHNEGREPRLVVDDSVCNTNALCHVPESYSNPTLASVRAAFPLRGDPFPLGAFAMDVKAAHKSIRVRESDQGLLGIQAGGRYFFYKVCPFGATFSAMWFARLGSFFVRALHLLIFVRHALFLYVDDFPLLQDVDVLDITASLCITFCVCFGVQLSWRKLQLGASVVWIGWELNFHAGAPSVPQDKRDRLAILINTMLQQRSKVDRRDLHKVTGMIQWLLQAFPMARAWIGTLYRDLRCPPATLHSLDPAYFADLYSCLDDGMLFVKVPSGTAIPIGSRLLEARRIPMTQRQDLHKVVLSGKRVWLRVADPAAPTRTRSDCSVAFLKFWQRWCKTPGILRALEAPRRATVVAAADAMGQGDRFAIGGFLRFSSCVIWFSESFTVQDFAFSGLTLSDDASNDISCYECLAQIALLHCACAVTSSGRLCVRVPSWTDNTGAESVANRLYTSKYPLCMFAQRLALFSCFTIFLAREMNWRIGFPAGTARTHYRMV